jgi:hypothetical protein
MVIACTGGKDTGIGDWTGFGEALRRGPSIERRLPGLIEVIAHKYNQYQPPLTSTNTYRTPTEKHHFSINLYLKARGLILTTNG